MKSLVIYDSSFGNTKKVAEEIAKVLDAKCVRVSDFKKSDLEGVELVVVGSPINGWRPLPSVTAFLNSLEKGYLKGIKATTFDTRVKLFIHGDAMKKMAKSLKNAGAQIIIPPHAFYVGDSKENSLLKGELEKAESWAKSLKTQNDKG